MVRVSYSLIDIGLYTCIGITVQLGISDLLQQWQINTKLWCDSHLVKLDQRYTWDRVICFIKDINILLLAELKMEHP
jgi:hypothetical protein